MRATIRYASAVVFLLISLLMLSGCNRHPGQTAQALNSNNQPASTDQQNANQAPAADQSDNGGAADNGSSTAPAQSSPTIANSQGYPPPSGSARNANTAPTQPQQDAPAAGTNTAPAQPLIIPAGTPVVVRLQQSLSSASAVAGERFDAVLDLPLVVQDQMIAPVGTAVTGHVIVARRSGRLHHPGEIGLTLDSITLGQQRVRLVTSSVVARGASHKKRNWGWIGGGTGGGALIGALAAGGKGALIGGGIGAAAGTTTALLTGKKDVTFGAERRLTFRLHRDVALQG